MPIQDHIIGKHNLTIFDHYHIGRLYRIPRCCIVRFMIDITKYKILRQLGLKHTGRGKKKGACFNPVTQGVYVPCCIFHESHMTHNESFDLQIFGWIK